jgi:hypothetical protein
MTRPSRAETFEEVREYCIDNTAFLDRIIPPAILKQYQIPQVVFCLIRENFE